MSKRYPGNFITGNPVALSQTSNSGVWDLKDNYHAVTNGTWQEVDGIYEIPRSLRFRASASAYLSRTPASNGNRKTWTYSVWVKRSVVSSGGTVGLLSANGTTSPRFILAFDGDKLWILEQNSSGTAIAAAYSPSYQRDTSAWYHIVVVMDTTLANTADRLKSYINGVQQAMTSTNSITQNYDSYVMSTSYATIIGQTGGSNYFDGYMTEANFVDGQALDPSYFGYFDATTNIWQPKKYTGTYGTNGFYLPFNENQSVTNLGRNFAGSNYQRYSEDGTQSMYNLDGGTITIGQTIAPDGSNTGNKLLSNTATGNHRFYTYQGNSNSALPSGTIQCVSAYVKALPSSPYSVISFANWTGSSGGSAYFNLSTGQPLYNISWPTGSGFQYVGNGWYRIWTTGGNVTSDGSGAAGVSIAIADASNNVSHTGNASAGFYFWGVQVNVGLTPDPYIKTTSAIIANDWTLNNFSVSAGATYDSMVDSPTNVFTSATDVGGTISGNYAILNHLEGAFGNITISNAGLTLTSGGNSGYHNCSGTIAPEGNKGYFEVTCTNSPNGHIGVSSAVPNYLNYAASPTADTIYLGTDGSVYNIYTSTIKSGSITAPSSGEVIMVAFDFTDAANKKLWFGRQGTWGLDASNNTGNPAAGTNATVTSTNLLSTSNYRWYFALNNGAAFTFNFGQRAFAYSPPAGFGGLCTTNMQARGTTAVGNAAVTPNKWMDVNVYGGNGNTNSVKTKSGFTPDLVWLKSRSIAGDHYIWDTTRGGGSTADLITNRTAAEGYNNAYHNFAFRSDGFDITQISPGNEVNYAGSSYVAWQWKQSPTSGFNIITYTGNGASSRTITHNLGVAPKFIMTKRRDSTGNWHIYHKGVQDRYAGEWLYLNLSYTHQNTANATDAPYFKTEPTSSVFSIAGDGININNATYVSYVWAEVPGFSKMGYYYGNGSSDGTFTYTGFKPAFILYKAVSGSAYNWGIYDAVRDKINPVSNNLAPNTTDVDSTYSNYDILSNGFKARANGNQNESGAVYAYVAFAESPFALNNRAR